MMVCMNAGNPHASHMYYLHTTNEIIVSAWETYLTKESGFLVDFIIQQPFQYYSISQ